MLVNGRNWSFADLEREVRGNLLYREFTHIGAAKVPDARTLGRPAQALGPEVIEKLQVRIVALAQDHGVVAGRRVRVDPTVVESDIHYRTDSGLMGKRSSFTAMVFKEWTLRV
jgi:IS5 family transposase